MLKKEETRDLKKCYSHVNIAPANKHLARPRLISSSLQVYEKM